jgi:hypothetical protein
LVEAGWLKPRQITDLVPSKISTVVLGGTAALHAYRVWGAVIFDHEIGCVWLAVPQPPERQCIGNQIDAAFIFAGAGFVNVFNLTHFLGLREADLSHMYAQEEADLFHG